MMNLMHINTSKEVKGSQEGNGYLPRQSNKRQKLNKVRQSI